MKKLILTQKFTLFQIPSCGWLWQMAFYCTFVTIGTYKNRMSDTPTEVVSTKRQK